MVLKVQYKLRCVTLRAKSASGPKQHEVQETNAFGTATPAITKAGCKKDMANRILYTVWVYT